MFKFYRISVSLTNAKENKASKLEVNFLSNSFFSMTEEFDCTFPELELQGIYRVHGTVLGKAVNGNGEFK